MKLSLPAKKADAIVKVGGFLPFTTVDFPGRLAAVVFLQGCPWRCAYCHNSHLRNRRSPASTSWQEVLRFLKRRRGLLEGVVFSGGEPTLQKGLPQAMLEVRDLGFVLGLHTSGMFPSRLLPILPMLEWVGLDMKAPPDERYDRVTGRKGSAALFLQSFEHILHAGVRLELRTTVDGVSVTQADWQDLQTWLKEQHLPSSKFQKASLGEKVS